ncbi:uncharacterized protein STEHIDRAFT_142727 [Stereum hirsutum FP-91666 SS1]|uniref:uncharacterized protein n=1 Tax=Stereum hirsutum (strain FP-91666) TaxID=721885 RepID=UPI0004449871|nr:uncharacterized protein STEHIDRAFT_142727 [Stereum hirsutum FP-91666 SS1]EIM80872.1 hypothetical protein STEHIDRAFT_142727 [Stereum hirsutum FP-91666 SS1]
MSSSLDETSEQIFTEKSFLQGALLAGVAYGTEVTLFAMTFWHLLRTRSGVNSKRKYIFLAYISVIFILGTLFYASNAQFTQLAFIDNRNITGGPGVYEETSFSIPIDELGNVCAIMSTWLCDALLLWRFYVIYNTGRALWAIMFFPSLLFLGSFVTGLLFLLEVSASSPWSPGSPAASINWTIPFFSLSLSLNIILTIAITLRLLVFRRNIVSAMGTSHGSQYASIAAMIVESDAIFSTFSLLFLVPFAMNNPLNEVFFQALSGVQIIATLLIMFRVAQGKSWDTDTMTHGLTAGSLPFNTAGSSQFSADGGRRGGYGMNEGHAMQRIQFTKPLPSGMSASALASTGASESTVRTLGGSKDALSVAVDDLEKV